VSTIPMGAWAHPMKSPGPRVLASEDSSFVTGIELFVTAAERRSSQRLRPCALPDDASSAATDVKQEN